jgi:hypothetical protein
MISGYLAACYARRYGTVLRVLRRGVVADWLRGDGSTQHGTGPLFRAGNQAREIGLPKAPEGGVVTAAPGREKGKLSDAMWLMCSLDPSRCLFTGRPSI